MPALFLMQVVELFGEINIDGAASSSRGSINP